ncbi:unnamed protein product [Phytomonas sp. EM1]|nr:unnamed protein product [Phytomonas sp. EM1]|eukprot:CCW65814.1 unnamed protein product [Phytomonas sp. isolate EM1]
MLTCGLVLRRRNGFYIANHPWLKLSGFVKIGFSTSLETRLQMASFQTCFTPEWYYHVVFECEAAKEALLLEQSVLYCVAERRVANRELIRATEDEVAELTRLIVQTLNINVVERKRPEYSKQGGVDIQEDESLHLGGTSQVAFTNGKNSSHEIDPAHHLNRSELSIMPYMHLLNSIKHRTPDLCTSASDNGVLASRMLPYSDESVAEAPLFYDEWGEFDKLTDKRSSIIRVDAENYTLKELRPYQIEAVERVKRELEIRGKTICQMACRCGKTPVAFHIMKETLVDRGNSMSARLLYLVPGLSLLRQTVKKLYHYGLKGTPLLLIGSDPNPIFLESDYSVTMTTDPALIHETVRRNERIVVFSTYHSSPLLEQMNVFALTVFDECHRVCGSSDKTPFNTILHLPPSGRRLFLTATPTYDTPLRMNNENLFGGIAYRYYLREGIDSGHVNPFSVRIILGASLNDMNPYFFEAMSRVDKMLVFCRNIEHAEQLGKSLQLAMDTAKPTELKPLRIFVAHSLMGGAGVADTLDKFSGAQRAILFNVRLFQEGVEIPDLNAVFFAAPRYSSRDIIQSICRPLNKLPNKPNSYVFLPAAINSEYPANSPINLQNFSTLVPFTDALMDEDPTLFEYMLDPQRKSYNIDVVGVRALKLSSEEIQKFILPAIRRGVRYSNSQTDRLRRAARLPWKQAFAELKRIVLECNRYPKTNDAWVIGDTSVSMNLFYCYARRGYAQYLAGQQTFLETYQIRDLESLPQWRTYGTEGPYPWKECLKTLEDHLAKYGVPPPLDVHRGGFIGLNATPFERLSGFLMRINQSDGKDRLRLDSDKQRDLDRVCGQYGLQWRKRRNKVTGMLIENSTTFISILYDQFKQLYKNVDHLPVFQKYLAEHFPGYPEKHTRMENLERLQEGRVPPRCQPHRRRRKATATSDSRQVGQNNGIHVGRHTQNKDQTVMCRVCRIHIKASAYRLHIQSPEHLACQEMDLSTLKKRNSMIEKK